MRHHRQLVAHGFCCHNGVSLQGDSPAHLDPWSKIELGFLNAACQRLYNAEFIIPTVHNVLAIERALRVAAERYITVEQVDLALEHAVGRVVRAFDPCIACATH